MQSRLTVGSIQSLAVTCNCFSTTTTTTYGFITQLLDSAVKKGRLAHGGGDVPGHIKFEIGVNADIAAQSAVI